MWNENPREASAFRDFVNWGRAIKVNIQYSEEKARNREIKEQYLYLG